MREAVKRLAKHSKRWIKKKQKKTYPKEEKSSIIIAHLKKWNMKKKIGTNEQCTYLMYDWHNENNLEYLVWIILDAPFLNPIFSTVVLICSLYRFIFNPNLNSFPVVPMFIVYKCKNFFNNSHNISLTFLITACIFNTCRIPR